MVHATEQHVSSAREQNLLRCFSVIHRTPKYHCSDCDRAGNHIEKSACHINLLKKCRCGKFIPSKNNLKVNRRESLTAEKSSPKEKVAKPPISRDEEFLMLPFPKPSVDKKQPVGDHHYRRYRNKYALGETVRSSSHMLIEPTSEQAIHVVSS